MELLTKITFETLFWNPNVNKGNDDMTRVSPISHSPANIRDFNARRSLETLWPTDYLIGLFSLFSAELDI